MPRSERRGMAIVVVLTLCLAIFILGASYIKTVQQQKPVNPLLLAFAQADILAQGVTQIAALKFKELPGPFYYGYIASRRGTTTFLDTFKGDALLAGTVTNPLNAVYSTEYSMFSSKMYQDMNLKISVAVNLTTRDGKNYSRLVEHTINGIRQRAN
ncbi:MAG TPA: hypothetical protein PLP29_06410 [Candidatus Ozemobacteraceae bacterium]|nr:hypothetical protein [Candidatus Ozemobacteraceae bacterium]